MKVAVVLCLAFAFVAATPVKNPLYPRRYDPKEADANRMKYMVVQDGDGKYHIEDLTRPPSFKASSADVTFYLYTRENPDTPDVIPGTDFGAISNSHFKAGQRSAFISHGWNNNYLSGVNVNIRPALIAAHDVNVFVVDWNGPANEFYTTAKAAVPVVGEVVGNFINYITSNHGVSTSNIHLIGHSLGAHVAGCAGAAVNGLVYSIVGLDPAGPLYDINALHLRLDDSDAQFVHIIHSNAGLLGFSSSIGHADYFPNGGGSSQPGCGIDLVGTCAHSRSYEFYAESFRNSGGFRATLCDSKKNYENGNCDGNPTSHMGQFLVDRSASGDYYLTTNSASPYSQS